MVLRGGRSSGVKIYIDLVVFRIAYQAHMPLGPVLSLSQYVDSVKTIDSLLSC